MNRLHLWTLSALGVIPGKRAVAGDASTPRRDITSDGMVIVLPLAGVLLGLVIAMVAS